MALINEQGQLLGRFNIIDVTVMMLIGLAVLGVLLVQSGTHVTSGEVVEGESDIAIVVQVSNLKTLDQQLFVPGESTSITIRNQPRGSVTIKGAKSAPVQTTLMGKQGQAVSVMDFAEPHGYDFVVTLQDHALVTKGGYVANGVKIKVGQAIELEGFKYRVYGKIVDIKALP